MIKKIIESIIDELIWANLIEKGEKMIESVFFFHLSIEEKAEKPWADDNIEL